MEFDSKLTILVFGITGSMAFLFGFSLSLMAKVKYTFIALCLGLVVGGATYIGTMSWPFGYLIGGLVLFFVGAGLGIYHFITHFQIASSIPEDESRIIRMTKVDESTQIRPTSGSW